MAKLDGNGSIQWQKCYGGNGDDTGTALRPGKNQGWVLAGSSLSNDLDVSGNHGQYDFWVVKLNSFTTGVPENFVQPRFFLYPNPAHEIITISGLKSGGEKSYRIFDSKGVAVLSGMIYPGNDEIKLDGLTNGLYTFITEEGSSRLVVHQK